MLIIQIKRKDAYVNHYYQNQIIKFTIKHSTN